MALDDATVNSIAAETEDAQQDRARVIHKQTSLNVAYSALRALDQSRISGTDGHDAWSPLTSDGNDSPLEGLDNPDVEETLRPENVAQYSEGSRHVSNPFFGSMPKHVFTMVEPDPTTQPFTFGQGAENNDWSSPIGSLEPVPASTVGKQTKKSKKKSRTLSNDPQATDQG